MLCSWLTRQFLGVHDRFVLGSIKFSTGRKFHFPAFTACRLCPVSLLYAHVSACDGFCIIRPAVACCVRLGLSLLCVPLLYRPVFATLARCAHLIRLPLSCISAPPPALAHAWCMLVPAFCSSLPVSVLVHHSGSSGVERAEFTPYPSEPIEKTYPIQMVKGVYILRIVSVCVCVTIRTSGGAFY